MYDLSSEPFPSLSPIDSLCENQYHQQHQMISSSCIESDERQAPLVQPEFKRTKQQISRRSREHTNEIFHALRTASHVADLVSHLLSPHRYETHAAFNDTTVCITRVANVRQKAEKEYVPCNQARTLGQKVHDGTATRIQRVTGAT